MEYLKIHKSKKINYFINFNLMRKIILPILMFTLSVSCNKSNTSTNNQVTQAPGTFGVQYVGGTWSNVGITYSKSPGGIIMKSYAGNTIKTTYISPDQIKLEVTNTSSPMSERSVTLPLFNKTEGGPGGYSSYTFKNDIWTVTIDQNYPGTVSKKGLTIFYSKIAEDLSSTEGWNALRSSED